MISFLPTWLIFSLPKLFSYQKVLYTAFKAALVWPGGGRVCYYRSPSCFRSSSSSSEFSYAFWFIAELLASSCCEAAVLTACDLLSVAAAFIWPSSCCCSWSGLGILVNLCGWSAVKSCFGVCPNSVIWTSRAALCTGSLSWSRLILPWYVTGWNTLLSSIEHCFVPNIRSIQRWIFSDT